VPADTTPTVPADTTPTGPAGTASEVQPHSLTPYLAVSDARRAIDWYVEVFAGRRRGEPIVMPDGRIGHVEIAIGDSVLMLADEHPELGLLGPAARGGVTQSIVVEVPDVDETVHRAVQRGGVLTRAVADYDYGRNGVVNDPFGHRWMISSPTPAQPAQPTEPAQPAQPTEPAQPSAGRAGPGDVGYVTIKLPDDEAAKRFYGSVLDWRFHPGSVERGWQVADRTPPAGIGGGAQHPEVQLCYLVEDVDAAVHRVREQGGEAEEPAVAPYGRIAACVDDQGMHFQLLQPIGG
jgi:uncharacterized glyoxalase superfamily protein PhnB